MSETTIALLFTFGSIIGVMAITYLYVYIVLRVDCIKIILIQHRRLLMVIGIIMLAAGLVCTATLFTPYAFVGLSGVYLLVPQMIYKIGQDEW